MRKKRILWAIAGIIVLLTGVIVFGAVSFGHFSEPSEQLIIAFDKLEGYGADVIVYGNLKLIEGAEAFARKITTIDEENLSGDKPNTYHMIVLYDWDEKLKITDEELELLRSFCMENYYDLIYLGYRYEQFQRNGFFKYPPSDGSDGFSYECYIYHEDGIPYVFNGDSWEDPSQPDTYYNNPFTTMLGFDEDEVAGKDLNGIWDMISIQALESLEYEQEEGKMKK